MKHIKFFEQKAIYDSYINGNSVLPNVSYIMDVNEVFYNPLVERNNVIRYYSSQQENVKEISGNSIISHEFSDGIGTIVYSEDVTMLPSYFIENGKITSIELPNSITSIGEAAFYNCTSLESIELPNSITSIAYRAFSWCSSLESVELPNQLQTLEPCVFENCGSLTYVKLPSSITSVKNNAFDGCVSLKELYYDGYMNQYKQIEWDSYQMGLELERIICLDSVIELNEVQTVESVDIDEYVYNVKLNDYQTIQFSIMGEDGIPITNAVKSQPSSLENYYFFVYDDDSIIEEIYTEFDQKLGQYCFTFKALKTGHVSVQICAGPGPKDYCSVTIDIYVEE